MYVRVFSVLSVLPLYMGGEWCGWGGGGGRVWRSRPRWFSLLSLLLLLLLLLCASSSVTKPLEHFNIVLVVSLFCVCVCVCVWTKTRVVGI